VNSKHRYSQVTAILDNETGEVIAEKKKTYISPNYVRFKENYKFTKTYHTQLLHFDNKAYYKYFYFCEQHLEAGTNRLIERSKEMFTGKSLTSKDLSVICAVSKETMDSFIKFCFSKKIIRKLDIDNQFFGYFMNPIYAFNGNAIDPILYLMFKDYGVKEHISQSGINTLNQYIDSFSEKQMIENRYKKA